MSEEAKMVLFKFGAIWCPPCQSMAKARTLEKFVEAHPNVRLELYEEQKDDTATGPDESTYDVEEWGGLCDKHDVQSFPSVIFYKEDQGELVELARSDGAVSGPMLEKLYAKALKGV